MKTEEILVQVCLLVLIYLAASVNFAILLFWLAGKGDPRNSFSGNAGTSNVFRQAGLPWAVAVLILDFGRAVLVAFLSMKLLGDMWSFGAVFFIAGNRWPLFHRFSGGKGVASFLGFSAVLCPWYALAGCAAWLVTYGVTRRSFFGSISMICVLCAGLLSRSDGHPICAAGVVVTSLMVIFAHRPNWRAFVQEIHGNH